MGKKYKDTAKETPNFDTAAAPLEESVTDVRKERPKFVKYNERAMQYVEESLHKLKEIEQDAAWHVDTELDELVLECSIFGQREKINFSNPRNVTAAVDFYVQGIMNGIAWARKEMEANNEQVESA